MTAYPEMNLDRMRVVIVGHVDHGKSTVIGRLLSDTGSLPEGKLEQVRANCKKNSKPFEYAFLLDALKDEQEQGITIDSARCFFNTKKRHYIVIDAPGHIEFLKNMVTGAANAESALIVIDAYEGIRENTKRHGYLISMLGIKQVVVLVNKMDLVDYSEEVFKKTQEEYTKFLRDLNVEPISFVPISAFEGDNMIAPSDKTPWYKGNSVLDCLEALQIPSDQEKMGQPFRFPLQAVYKFTEQNDDRRIFSGTVETGKIKVGDEVLFLPSNKRSNIKSVERFNAPEKKSASVGEAIGFTLETQVYLQPGELMVNPKESLPLVSARFRANVFWMGHAPLIQGKSYKLKISSKRVPVKLVKILNVLDATELSAIQNKKQLERHDVGECVFETARPIAFDLPTDIESTGRFVLVDNHEIAGGGIILESLADEVSTLKNQIEIREQAWDQGLISVGDRVSRFQHQSKFIVFIGDHSVGKRNIAKHLERRLFEKKHNAYYLAFSNLNLGLDQDIDDSNYDRVEHMRRLGELARIMTDSGQIFITTLSNVDGFDLKQLKLLNEPNEILVINVGDRKLVHYEVDLTLALNEEVEGAVDKVHQLLNRHQILEYYI